MGKQWKQWQMSFIYLCIYLFILDSQITADGACSHEIKRCLLLGRKVMINLLLLLLSHFSRVRLCVIPWTAAHQAPLSTGFSRQEYCSGLPFHSPHDQPRQHIKKQRHYFANKGQSIQGYGFPSSHVRMWELNCKENWAPKNWCFWTVVLEKTLESPLDCKEIQLVHPQGNQSWIFIGRADVQAETPILWPHNAKNWLIWKDPCCWERLKVGGEGDDRGWDGSMASSTQWTWVWVSSGS